MLDNGCKVSTGSERVEEKTSGAEPQDGDGHSWREKVVQEVRSMIL